MFSDCLELIGDIIAIYPIPKGQLSIPVPFQIKSSSISPSSVIIGSTPASVSSLNAVSGFMLSSVAHNASASTSIVIEPGSTAKHSSKTSSSGSYAQVKISAKTYESPADIQPFINQLNEAEYFDVILRDAIDNLYLIRGSENATTIQCDYNLPRTTMAELSIEVDCPNGIQPIIS